MIGRFLKGLFKIGVIALGVAAIVGVWDYNQQANASEADYSFELYQSSLADRYGHQADLGIAVLTRAKTAVGSGVAWIAGSGLVDFMGDTDDTMTSLISGDTGDVAAEVTESVSDDAGAPVQIAQVPQDRAPKTSLFPRARTLQ